jgi:hypothetical protein
MANMGVDERFLCEYPAYLEEMMVVTEEKVLYLLRAISP